MKKLHILKDLHSFLLLWGSQTVSSLGTAMTEYALIIWVYEQNGTASSITTLTLCSFLPTILFRFIGGTLADRWDKKRIMLFADLAAACGTVLVLFLFTGSALRIWHLYVINILLSLLNSLQIPASFVATSLLVPKEHYTRAGGLQGISGAVISILAPALGSVLLTFGGLSVVLLCDLLSFFVALVVLLLIKIPKAPRRDETERESIWKSCADGLRYLRDRTALLRLTLFFSAVNFLAKLGNDGMISPFVLGRTGNNQQVLGMVQSSVALGLLAGSLLVTVMKPARRKTRVVFLTTTLIFLGNIVQGLSVQPWVWCAAAFGSYLMAAVMNANLTAVMRAQIPSEVQGRVFSVRDTLQNGLIPLSLFLGGILADYVFEPFMAAESSVRDVLALFVGTGTGAGIAVMFLIAGILGCLLGLSQLRHPIYRELEDTPPEKES